jgi:alternate signal-mediated exported protein
MSKTRARSRKAAVVISSVLAIIIALSATFAWVTSSFTKVNHFENQGYITDGTVVVNEDDFEPPEEWQPGQTIDKKVSVTNTGAGDVLVRVSYDELLNILGDNGNVTYTNIVVPGADKIQANTDITAYVSANWTEFASAKITSSVGGDYDLDDLTGDGITPTKANLHILKSTNGDALVAYYEYAPGKYQSVKVKGHTVSVAGDEIEITEELDFAYFTAGSDVYAAWSGAFLNTAWSGQTNSLGAIPATTATSALNSAITLQYTGSFLDTLATDSWYYNAQDGYFYYIGIVESGTSTAGLLESVTLLGNASGAFKNVSYDLAITVEAIQADVQILETVGNGGEWDLSTNPALNTALKALFPTV